MSNYTVKIPDGAARCGIALGESISKWFNTLSADIKEASSKIQTIDNKFDN